MPGGRSYTGAGDSGGRSSRGFNLACRQDVAFFAAVTYSEPLVRGFSNRDLRRHPFPPARSRAESRRRRPATPANSGSCAYRVRSLGFSVSSVVGSLAFQWIVVGLAEETMFRGMIQTYLMKTLKGTTRLAGHDFHVGTVAAALLWGVFHLINVLVMPFLNALFTAVITTFAGLLMGYAYQRTRSLLTTILVHNALFGVPLTIGYLIYAFI